MGCRAPDGPGRFTAKPPSGEVREENAGECEADGIATKRHKGHRKRPQENRAGKAGTSRWACPTGRPRRLRRRRFRSAPKAGISHEKAQGAQKPAGRAGLQRSRQGASSRRERAHALDRHSLLGGPQPAPGGRRSSSHGRQTVEPRPSPSVAHENAAEACAGSTAAPAPSRSRRPTRAGGRAVARLPWHC